MTQPPDQQTETAQRRARVIHLRRRRLSFADIGTDLGVTAQRAHQIYKAALQDTPVLGVEEHRTEQLALIDDAIQALRAIAEADPEQAVAAWNAIRGWQEREAKLMGLDAETKVNVSGGVKYEVVGVDVGDLV